MAYWKIVLVPALAKLGFWGAGAVALLDSSSIPVPMDAYLAIAIWNIRAARGFRVKLLELGLLIATGAVPAQVRHPGDLLVAVHHRACRVFKRVDADSGTRSLAAVGPGTACPPATTER